MKSFVYPDYESFTIYIYKRIMFVLFQYNNKCSRTCFTDVVVVVVSVKQRRKNINKKKEKKSYDLIIIILINVDYVEGVVVVC